MRRENSVLDAERVDAMLKRLSAAERKAALAGLGLLARAASEEMATKSAMRERAKEIGREL